MLRCKEATKLVSRSLDSKLSLYQRAQLWMHLTMCRLCWGFRQDAVKLHEEIHAHNAQLEHDSSSAESLLPAEAKQRIKQSLGA